MKKNIHGINVRTHLRADSPVGSALNHNEALVRHAAKPGLKVRTRVRAGQLTVNHNEAIVRAQGRRSGIRVRTHLKAAGTQFQHNETLVRNVAKGGLKMRTSVRAGSLAMNHNDALVRSAGEPRGVKIRTSVRAGLVSNNHDETLVRYAARGRCQHADDAEDQWRDRIFYRVSPGSRRGGWSTPKRMMPDRFGLAAGVLVCSLVLATVARAQDVAGGKDHPLIARYPGSQIWQYDAKEFNEVAVPLGGIKGDNFAKTEKIAGRTTTINYNDPLKRSVLEVFRNYDMALKSAGFQVLFTCADAACGAGQGAYVDQLRYWPWASGYGQRHLTGKLARPEGDVYVTLHVQGRNPDQTQTFLTIVETKPMETGLVTVDAAALGKDLGRTGHVAIYGIYFDTGKADVKPESEAALTEITKLLTEDAALRLHVVGHTDSVGDLAMNMDLSRRRAQAVVQVLTTKHGIAAARLRADGVGPLAPVASNDTDDGRAKNRRVELVKQ